MKQTEKSERYTWRAIEHHQENVLEIHHIFNAAQPGVGRVQVLGSKKTVSQ